TMGPRTVSRWPHRAVSGPEVTLLRFGLVLGATAQVGDDLRLRPTLAPRASLLAALVVVSRRGLAGLRRVRSRLGLVGAAAVLRREGGTSLDDRVRDRLADHADRADRVVVTGDRNGEQVRIGVGVSDGDDGDAELVRLVDGDVL